jgi:hypothetical protein
MSSIKSCVKRIHNATRSFRRIRMRAHLNADTLFAQIRNDFDRVPDHRASNGKIPLTDALMSGFAMFSLKDPSLLAFDVRRKEDPSSLHTVYGVEQIPCDSQMRDILDLVTPESLRRPFKHVFSQLQRGKAMEKMTWLDGHYLLALDGTGIFSSEKVSSAYCLRKRKRNGTIEYYQQMLAGAFVHPERREVIPTCPEMIIKQDGASKGDCERNAAKRYLADLRREHPHLKIIVTEDALSANAPHIRILQEHNLRYILGVKPKDHEFLFAHFDVAIQSGEVEEIHQPDKQQPGVTQHFRFAGNIPLNKTSQDEIRINFLEYWETDIAGKTGCYFTWITDFDLTPANVQDIMRAGRARWRIENEAFNTLKNQGYNLEHNYGLGKKHLSAVFVHLMMLAFLVDQVQQMCCPLFQAAHKKCGSKRYLWEKIRSYFTLFEVPSMEEVLHRIAHALPKQLMQPMWG